MTQRLSSKRVFVAGATGFVGRALHTTLQASGVALRLGARTVCDDLRVGAGLDDGSKGRADAQWVHFDLDKPETLKLALSGCNVAVYLVHQIGAPNYPERECAAAEAFAHAAGAAGIERLVYLGGVKPAQAASRHLASRAATGDALAQAGVPVVELRAGMVVGHGSASWQLVRDLAQNLPFLLRFEWIENHSWPVALDDVICALGVCALAERVRPGCYAVPGPERLPHRAVIQQARREVGGRPLLLVPAPPALDVMDPRALTPWLKTVTSVDSGLAGELIAGLSVDLDPAEELLWNHIKPGYKPVALGSAMRLALRDARCATAFSETRLPADASLDSRDRGTTANRRLGALGRRLATLMH